MYLYASLVPPWEQICAMVNMSEDLHTRVRMPPALHDKIEAVRRETGRSFTAEVVARLERTFIEDDERRVVEKSAVDELRDRVRQLEGRVWALESKSNS